MDSQERHELKQNELEAFLVHFRDWWKKHGTRTLTYVLIAIVAFVGVRWYRGRDARRMEAAYTTLASTNSPIGKEDAARRYSDLPGYASYALLQAGDITMRAALVAAEGDPAATDTDEPADDDDQAAAMFRQAAERYQRVIDLNDSPLHVLNARLGLATAYESLGEFDQARAQYDAIIDEAGEGLDNFAAIARQRLEDFERIQKPIVFPEAPVPDEITGEAKPQAEPTVIGPPVPDDVPLPGDVTVDDVMPGDVDTDLPDTPQAPAMPDDAPGL